MMFFYPKEDILKISGQYLYWKYVRKGGSRRGVLGGLWEFLTKDMEGMVIPDVRRDVFLVLKLYPDHFMYIPKRKCVRNGG